MGFGVKGLGFGVWGLGFGVWGLGFGVWGLGFRVSDSVFRDYSLGSGSEASGVGGTARTPEPSGFGCRGYTAHALSGAVQSEMTICALLETAKAYRRKTQRAFSRSYPGHPPAIENAPTPPL